MDVPPGLNGSEEVVETNSASAALHQAARPPGRSVPRPAHAKGSISVEERQPRFAPDNLPRRAPIMLATLPAAWHGEDKSRGCPRRKKYPREEACETPAQCVVGA